MRVINGTSYYQPVEAPNGTTYYDIGTIIKIGDELIFKPSAQIGARTEAEARRLIGL